jgi:hypothetical protein
MENDLIGLDCVAPTEIGSINLSTLTSQPSANGSSNSSAPSGYNRNPSG